MYLSPSARHFWTLILVDAVLITSALLAIGTPSVNTIVHPLRLFLQGRPLQTDSWRPMQAADAYLRSPHATPVYDEMLDNRGVKFQYPLSSLLFTRHLSLGQLNAISWCAVLVVAAAAWRIMRTTSRGTPLDFGPGDHLAGLAIVGLTLTFYPVVKAYELGQIQAWINGLFALAVVAWVARREDLAGVAIGVACLLKPTYLLFGVWGLVRRRFRFVAPMVAIVGLGVVAAFVAYGVTDNVNYLHALAAIGRRGESFYPNQSVNGLLNRLLGNGDSLKFDRRAFAPFNPVVYDGTLAAFAAFSALALWLPSRSSRAGSVVDFAIAGLTFTLTAPVAWDHHYGILIPIFAATAPTMLRLRPVGRWTAPVVVACYIVASQSFVITNRFAGTWANFLQSYLLFAAVLLLGIMYGLLFSEPADLPTQAGSHRRPSLRNLEGREDPRDATRDPPRGIVRG